MCLWVIGRNILQETPCIQTITSLAFYLLSSSQMHPAQDGGIFVPWLQRRDTYLCWLKGLSQSTFLKIHIHCPLPNSFTAGKWLYYVQSCLNLYGLRKSSDVLSVLSRASLVQFQQETLCVAQYQHYEVQRHLFFLFQILSPKFRKHTVN